MARAWRSRSGSVGFGLAAKSKAANALAPEPLTTWAPERAAESRAALSRTRGSGSTCAIFCSRGAVRGSSIREKASRISRRRSFWAFACL